MYLTSSFKNTKLVAAKTLSMCAGCDKLFEASYGGRCRYKCMKYTKTHG